MATTKSTSTLLLLLLALAVVAGNTFLNHQVSDDTTLLKFFSNGGAAFGFIFGVLTSSTKYQPGKIALGLFTLLFYIGAIAIAVLNL